MYACVCMHVSLKQLNILMISFCVCMCMYVCVSMYVCVHMYVCVRVGLKQADHIHD